jgi:hypothetical protein
MFPVPSNDTPPIVLADARAVAVAASPVHEPEEPLAFPVTFPENVPDKTSVDELKVNPAADLGPKSPVAAVTNKGKQVVSLLSSATVITAGVGAVPTNEVAVKAPVAELNERLDPDFGAKSPVAAVANNGKQVVSDDSSATVTAVATAAVPEVFWFPAEFTPGKSIFAEPLNETPPIFLAVVKVAADVAVALFPVHEPDEPLAFPVTFPVSGPLNAVAVKVSELELKVNPAADLGPKSPVAAVTNKGKQVVSLLSSAIVITVGVGAVPTNEVAFKAPVAELNERLDPDFGAKSPVAAVANNGKHVVSDDSSATVTVVAIAAVPEVFWFPDAFTPGRSMFPVPSKLTPPMFLAEASAVVVAANVAVAANPDVA